MGGTVEVLGAAVKMEWHAIETHQALESLAPQEAQVLRLLFGIGERPHSPDELGVRLGLSHQRVWQIRATALRKLRLGAVLATGWS